MVHIGLIGDFDSQTAAHIAIPKALALASDNLGIEFAHDWVATTSLETGVDEKLSKYHALWVIPGSPYESMQGALNGIKFAREHRVPMLGTCGGFQHMMIEYARNVLALKDAEHGETNPTASLVLVTPLTCSVSEQHLTFRLTPGSKTAMIYEDTEVIEQYGTCNYGLNREFAPLFEKTGMRIAGMDMDGDIRIMELSNHPFFIGTLFQPERSAFKNIVHPLITALLEQAQTRIVSP